jgi:hypothetical protein
VEFKGAFDVCGCCPFSNPLLMRCVYLEKMAVRLLPNGSSILTSRLSLIAMYVLPLFILLNYNPIYSHKDLLLETLPSLASVAFVGIVFILNELYDLLKMKKL